MLGEIMDKDPDSPIIPGRGVADRRPGWVRDNLGA